MGPAMRQGLYSVWLSMSKPNLSEAVVRRALLREGTEFGFLNDPVKKVFISNGVVRR
jgi:hypothetical protein